MMVRGLVAAVAAGAACTAAPRGAAPPAPAAVRVERGRFGDGADARGYTLVVPAAVVAGAAPSGLLVFLHGCTQDAADARRGTTLDAPAARAGLLVLYPEQAPTANAQRCWNWFDPAHQRRGAGEPATLAGMTQSVARAHGLDPARVHVAGMSAGGAMALVLAASYPELYASAASHSGVPLGVARTPAEAWQAMRTPSTAADPSAVRAAMGARARAVPLLVLHGDSDTVVRPGNGTAAARQWAAALGAAPGLEVDGAGESGAGGGRRWHEEQWVLGGAPVVRLVTVFGLGHAWSGGSPAGTFTDPRGPSAAELVVAHALAHPMTPAGP